jgi:hypothetical protein
MTRKNLGRRAAGFRNELSLGHVEPDVLMIWGMGLRLM